MLLSTYASLHIKICQQLANYMSVLVICALTKIQH
jgi:hypothetical protein